MSSSLRVIFAGTPEFAVPALEALVGSKHRVVAVYTQPDRPAGRGRELKQSAVKQRALEHGIPCEQPLTLRDPQAVAHLATYTPDVMVVVAYGLILPQAVLDIPRLGCVNIHGSLLPRWRGAAPIQRAVLAGDATSGVSIMRMEAGLDTGPVLLMRSLELAAHETSATLHDKLASLGAESLLESLAGLADGTLVATPQPAEGVTYAAKLRKEEALLDWSQSAAAIDRLVRGLNPWPAAETLLHGQQLKIWEAAPVSIETPQAPGTVLSAGATGWMVATGHQILNITRVQLAGRKAMAAGDFANAHAVAGAVLGK